MSIYRGMLAVTNRRLCEDDFLTRIWYLASTDIEGIILREKDLPEGEYEALAREVLAICRRQDKCCILHSYPAVARRLGCKKIHLPLPLLLASREKQEDLAYFDCIGSSVHSVEEAVAVWKAGASYLTAGHIFDTDCKKGLPGRGLPFLSAVCKSVSLPVYAIGGITPENMPEIRAAGAAGGCMMSLAMRMPLGIRN